MATEKKLILRPVMEDNLWKPYIYTYGRPMEARNEVQSKGKNFIFQDCSFVNAI